MSTSFADLDEYWRRREQMNDQEPRLAREGDRVRLREDVRTPSSKGRPARTVRAGTTGIVLRAAGSVLRVQFSDSDVIDEAIVSGYTATVVTEPDE